MARKKASLKGKGVDILLGGSSELESEGELAAPAVAGPPRPVAPTTASELAQPPSAQPAIVQPAPQAAAGAAPPTQPAEPAPLPNPFAEPSEPLPNPFAEPPTAVAPPAEAALSGFAFGAEAARGQPITPVVTALPAEEEPAPVVEAAASPSGSGAAGVAGVSTPEPGGPVTVPLPDDPRLLKKAPFGGLLDMSTPMVPTPETFEPPVQGTQQGFKLVAVSETKMKVTDAEVARRVGDRADKLWTRIDELYRQVAEGAITDRAKTSEALSHLRIARDKELEDPRQFDEAEYLVNVVQYMVTRAHQVHQWGSTYGVVVLIYGLLALAIFGAGLVLDGLGLLMNWLRPGLSADFATVKHVSDVFTLYNTVLWGGVGGVLGLIYSLLKHAAIQQDFDRQYMLWYFGQPFLGMLMGAIVHLFIVTGVFGLISATTTEAQSIGQTIAAITAVAAAFRQNYVYAWLEWLLKAVQPGGRKAEEAETSAGSGAPTTSGTSESTASGVG